MTAALDAFVADAKAVDLLTAFAAAGGSLAPLRRAGGEWVGPCPACGGTDRFGLNERKQLFVCRSSGGGGPLALVQHMAACDFLAACEIALGCDRPDLDAARRAERDADRERAAAERAARLAVEVERARQRNAEAERFQGRELERCLADWRAAAPLPGSPAERYLQSRALPLPDPAFVRCHPDLPYWLKTADSDRIVHRGPAMLVLFVRPDAGRLVPIGLHRTWLDLARPPKFRPRVLDPETGEALGTKKMRGTKAGGLLPLLGRLSTAVRIVAGEGIETVLAYARRDGLRADTFYAAAGDLGNLAGRAVPGSHVRVPGAVHRDRMGYERPVLVPGIEPDPASECLPVPAGVRELVLLGDGDSEPVATRAALKRGASRYAAPDRVVTLAIAPAGHDWAEIASTPATI